MSGRNVVRWLWLPVAFAVLYSGWVIWSRHSAAEEIEREAKRKEAEQAADIVRRFGGSDLKVLMFYANPPVVEKGKSGLLCYGVSNAKSVVIEPGVEGTGPSLSRCVDVKPARTTEYTLKARDAQGREVTQTVNITVR